jgi:GGDEF domain-containing protein
LGGDEFAVLINDEEFIGDETANALAATTSYPISIDDRLHYIGISIGKVHNDGGGDLLARADSAMYEAKRAGENIVGWGDHS